MSTTTAKNNLANGVAAPSIAETKAIVEEGFIYGLPIVMNYAVMYEYAVDRNSGQFKAPFNEINNEARVFTYEDTSVITPNSDTPYSVVWTDLRAEPIVLSDRRCARHLWQFEAGGDVSDVLRGSANDQCQLATEPRPLRLRRDHHLERQLDAVYADGRSSRPDTNGDGEGEHGRSRRRPTAHGLQRVLRRRLLLVRPTAFSRWRRSRSACGCLCQTLRSLRRVAVHAEDQ
jgi:hypothetical protein